MLYEIPPGYEYIALKTRSKEPLEGLSWTNARSLSYDDVQRILRMGGNYGVRLGPLDIVIDIDPRNGGDASKLPFNVYDFPIVRTPSHADAMHVYGRSAVPLRIRGTHPDYPGIDFKHVGGYVASVGCIHPNGGTYDNDFLSAAWPTSPLVLPAVLLEQITLLDKPTSMATPGEWSPEQLAATLARLDAADFRQHDAWFALMCACHEATNGAALDEFLDWSTSDELYANDGGAIRNRWLSLTAGKPGGAGAGTLLHIVAAHGVHDISPFSASEFESFGTPSVTPSGTKETSNMDGGALASTASCKSPLDDMNERFYVVSEDGKLRVLELRTSEELQVKTWIRHSKTDFYDVCQMIHHFPPIKVVSTNDKGKEKTSYIPMAVRWLDVPNPGKRVFPGGLVFMPETNNERVGDSLNLWRGFAYEPIEGDWSLLKELVRTVLCANDVASYEYTLNWLARTVQYPALPAGAALVFKGIKGTGKGTLGRALVKLFGTHGMQTGSTALLTGRFNAHLQDCVVMFADEAFYAGDRAGEAILKTLITEPTLEYEAKGMNPKTGRNCIHIFMASNQAWVVPAGLDAERRFAVFETLDEIRSKEFFKRLNAQLNSGGYEAMLYELLARDISNFHVHSVPQTKALAEQKIESMEAMERWIYHLLATNNWDGLPLYDTGHGKAILMADFRTNFAKFNDGRRVVRSDEIAIGFTLRNFLPDAKRYRIIRPETRIDLTSERQWALTVPPIEQAQKRFNEVLSHDAFM